MNICFVCPYAMSSTGGVQAHIRDIAVEMQKLGHRVTVISPGPASGLTTPYKHLVAGNSRRISFNQTSFDICLVRGAALKSLRQHLAENAYDIIHYHTIWSPLLPLQVLYYSRGVNVATFHDTPPDNLTGKLTRLVFKLLSRILIRHLQAVIAVSTAPAGHLARIPGRDIEILPPCIYLDAYRNTARKKTGRKEGTVRILFIGRLEERKGIFLLLQAYSSLLGEKLDVQLTIVGSGPLESRIRDYVRMENLVNIEMPGNVDEEAKADVYAACDIFCSPALHGESFGLVLVEAMASGKPVVAAANAGYRTVLGEKADTCLSRPGDADDLYRKLKQLVVRPELRRQLGEWGKSESLQYDCRTVVPKLLAVYNRALTLER